jgi:chemotaxis protein MotB
MARMHWIGFSFLVFALVGCVPQEKYNAMKLAHDAAMVRLAQDESQTKAALAEADAYKRQLDALMANGNNQNAAFANVTSQLTDLQGRYSQLEREYQDAMNRQGIVQVLPEPLTNALTEFANQNPDLVDFNSARGIVKFKSDLTFNSGSAELRPEARTAIGRFAQILNSPAAAGYELQVAGHTDSTRVANPATIKAGHHDNWFLSSHRAISVGKALMSQNVDSKRVAVVGYADQHPIANNASESGRAQNRRVEVLILPSTVRTPTATAEAGGNVGPGRTAKPVLNKDTDTVGADQRPLLNK